MPTDDWPISRERDDDDEPALALVIAWSTHQPHRCAEIATFADEGPRWCGGSGVRALSFFRERPGSKVETGPLELATRVPAKLRFEARPHGLLVEREAQLPFSSNGSTADRALLAPGDTVVLQGETVLQCVLRPRSMPGLRHRSAPSFEFGAPDEHELIGESAPTWALRDQLAFCALAATHTAILGESGTGKELAARTIHGLDRGPMVSRNAATLPAGLIDVELFGNARNFPNPGMPERHGLVGQADGGTLFLDEIAELPLELQSHLLRVLDSHGEYHRLGESTARRSKFRLVAATNREPSALKHDLLARLPLRVTVPGLDARREDVPLLVRRLLWLTAQKSPGIAGRFLGSEGQPRVDLALIDQLVRHRFTTHVRELEGLLWLALSGSHDRCVMLTREVLAQTSARAPVSPAEGTDEPTADELRRCLDEHDGNISGAARALGLANRFVLYRLLRKFGLEPRPAK